MRTPGAFHSLFNLLMYDFSRTGHSSADKLTIRLSQLGTDAQPVLFFQLCVSQKISIYKNYSLFVFQGKSSYSYLN